MESIVNPQLDLAQSFVQFTHRNVFLTGKAGTGKTTFLRRLKASGIKRMVVVAPTGVAAINAGGVTIHSFFQLPFGPIIPRNVESSDHDPRSRFSSADFKMSREKINIIRSLDLLVIDEISMVRADLLDAIDDVLRRYRRSKRPFGGVQLLLIGDIQQLPPVVKNEDWELLKSYYESLYFFDSLALKKTNYVAVELKHIYRQSNEKFIAILNKIRDNRLDRSSLDELNKRYIPNFSPKAEEGYITLTTHNRQAQELNDEKLRSIPLKEYLFSAKIEGDFPEFSYPTDKSLTLKVGAQVMFLKNDNSREKLFFNGKIGIVSGFTEEGILVVCADSPNPIVVATEKWDNMKYTLNEETKEITETPIGSFTQYPLKLAWAITIHKSQGLTFDRAIIYAGAAFAHGQVYVALSRCKTLEGLVLGAPIRSEGIINDSDVKEFNQKMEENEPDLSQLDNAKRDYQLELLFELFDYDEVIRELYTYQKQAKEHVSILSPELVHKTAEIIDYLRQNGIDISEKFALQIKQMVESNNDIEDNLPLQERLKKAVKYFSELTEKLIADITDSCIVELDNKAVAKSLSEPLERIFLFLKVKQACLSACEEGFRFKDFLNIRAKAQIEEPQRKKAAPTRINDKDPLTTVLKSWRNDKAVELGVDHYMILSQKSVAALAKEMPTSMRELKLIHGIGPQKLKQFGEELLRLIIDFRNQKGITTTFNEKDFEIEEKKAKTSKESKIASNIVSFELFKTGKNIEEIAKERNYSPTTIEGHLAQFVASGELDIYRIVERSKVQRVIDYLEKHPTTELTPIKIALGDDFSYGEIRMVVAHLRNQPH